MELLVTLAIVAIVAGIAMPSIQNILGGSQLSANSNQLVYSLQSARSEAIKRITPVAVCPSADPLANNPVCGGTYADGWIVFVDADGNGKRVAADEVILQSDALSPAFSVIPDNRFKSAIVFSIAGTSMNTAGVPISGDITVRHGAVAEERVVRIAASGRISTTSKVPTSGATK